jgi:hypothetical protein
VALFAQLGSVARPKIALMDELFLAPPTPAALNRDASFSATMKATPSLHRSWLDEARDAAWLTRSR